MAITLNGSGTITGVTTLGTALTSPTLTTPIVTTTMGVGNATPSASGVGITFPAALNASSDANTLDDYEEGTWTPTVTQASTNPTSITYSRQHGTYIKIGTLVYVTFNLYITAITNGSGQVRISGLPFTNQNVNESDRAVLSIGYVDGFATNLVPSAGIIQNNGTYIDLYARNAADA